MFDNLPRSSMPRRTGLVRYDLRLLQKVFHRQQNVGALLFFRLSASCRPRAKRVTTKTTLEWRHQSSRKNATRVAFSIPFFDRIKPYVTSLFALEQRKGQESSEMMRDVHDLSASNRRLALKRLSKIPWLMEFASIA